MSPQLAAHSAPLLLPWLLLCKALALAVLARGPLSAALPGLAAGVFMVRVRG